MKKKVVDVDNVEDSKPKRRRIVSWSEEEDDILREQIMVLGTENWAAITSKFRDKTTRQCRRRWFTYLNSDFKKGGWSPEEDKLLCEQILLQAQKVYGNRWTEIAKVVPGRTDNAVKNRFTTLCKKRDKREASAKDEDARSIVNLNNKFGIFHTRQDLTGGPDSVAPLERIKTTHVSTTTKNCNEGEESTAEHADAGCLCSLPFLVPFQCIHGCEASYSTRPHVDNTKEAVSSDGYTSNKTETSFLKEDDSKVLGLAQPAELLCFCATEVHTEKADPNLDNTFMVLHGNQKQNEVSNLLVISNSDADFQLGKFEVLVENLGSCDEGSGSSCGGLNLNESSSTTSEYSRESSLLSNIPGDRTEGSESEIVMLHQKIGLELQPDQIGYAASASDAMNIVSSNEPASDIGAPCEFSTKEFSSPLQEMPLFRALAAAIPSPQFSESEKHFLMKTLGMESPSPTRVTNPSQPPPCKRSLLHFL